MAIIKLINTTDYARLKNISRTTVWRQVQSKVLDCYVLSGSSKRYFVGKKPNIYKIDQDFLEELMTVEI